MAECKYCGADITGRMNSSGVQRTYCDQVCQKALRQARRVAGVSEKVIPARDPDAWDKAWRLRHRRPKR